MQIARSTTILSVRRGEQVALGGDGQVTLGNTVAKHDAIKIRRLGGGKDPHRFCRLPRRRRIRTPGTIRKEAQ